MDPKNNLLDESLLLLEEQKQEWDVLRKGYESLAEVKTKTIRLEGFSFTIQYNPGRITSTAAKTDTASINIRKCFLCDENRPAEQRGVTIKAKEAGTYVFYILGNPFPIFPEHFTITSKEHVPQKIKDNFNCLLYFSKVLSKGLTVFYNGPDCGASAPDHLHFQAGTKNYMPIEKEINSIEAMYSKPLYQHETAFVNSIDDGFRRMIQIKGDDEEEIAHAFNIFYDVYAEYPHETEPKMNIIALYNNGWNILIMLREKHRPEEYFKEEDKLVFSPAGVDYGGLCITPIEKDFIRMDERLLRHVFNQVSLGQDVFNEITSKLSYSLDHP